MWNLKNKTVVISGATNGIGKAAAIELSKENLNLLFTYRNQDLANELLAEIKALSPDTQVHTSGEPPYVFNANQRNCRTWAKQANWGRHQSNE